MSSPIIQFENFSFQYKSQAEPTLYNINLSIYPGEKVLIAGPSGCGKSTLASCINGLIPFAYPGEQSGSLKISGEEAKDTSIFQLSKTVGTVLQDPDGQFIGLTVAEDIAFVLENACTPQKEMIPRVKAVSEKVGIERHLDHAPDELSGGQKQRVSMAGVMINDVQVFLFDEPLANLDPATGKQAIELIDQIHQDTKAAIVIIEHRLEDVLWRDVDRIILMRDGKILLDSTPDQLLSTGLLLENGIREPLYLTAMRYAGVEITPESLPQSIRSVRLSEEDRRRVRDWGAQQIPSPPPEKGEVLLSAENIDFTYENGFHALKGVSLRIEKGELLAIVGTNGAGKSTFSKAICGFEKPQKGVLRFKGEDMSSLSIKERADRIGYVMQNPNQMISKSFIFDEVALGLRLRGVAEDEITRRVEETLKICGLYPFRKWPISALSFGQKKRVTIASILVLNPEMLILDEPTAGQDFRHYTEIMEFLRGLSALDITVVMITHDMHLMLEYAKRAVVFSQGQIIADDTSANILTSPDIIRRASLKETSLYDLALMCGAEAPNRFVQHFIDYDREARSHG
ncbi:ABC transporter ATP-binding protein [uncultured Oscillibacter sp.]|uniref:ABC transporter ATP-binding protein n=1 Tax=uncultured Oscillibacter sp. TaxID=876091 RepID=UPI0025D438C9|nr:ABC transporter ATP-binding protein [uncultured Oscillibacter sp.]